MLQTAAEKQRHDRVSNLDSRALQFVEQALPRHLRPVVSHGRHDAADGVLPALQILPGGAADGF